MTYSLCREYIRSITLENEAENKRIGFLRLAHLSGVAISHTNSYWEMGKKHWNVDTGFYLLKCVYVCVCVCECTHSVTSNSLQPYLLKYNNENNYAGPISRRKKV